MKARSTWLQATRGTCLNEPPRRGQVGVSCFGVSSPFSQAFLHAAASCLFCLLAAAPVSVLTPQLSLSQSTFPKASHLSLSLSPPIFFPHTLHCLFQTSVLKSKTKNVGSTGGGRRGGEGTEENIATIAGRGGRGEERVVVGMLPCCLQARAAGEGRSMAGRHAIQHSVGSARKWGKESSSSSAANRWVECAGESV